MKLSRRSVLLATLALAGCAGSPVIAPLPTSQEKQPASIEERPEHQKLLKAAEALSGLQSDIAASEEGPWRTAALSWCDEKLARLNSPDPFAEPLPEAKPTNRPAGELSSGLVECFDSLLALAKDTQLVSLRLLLLSCAVGVQGLANPAVLPALGGSPRRIDSLSDQQNVALSHTWALIYGLEKGLGILPKNDQLVEALTARLDEARSLRETLRQSVTLPTQPASLALPEMANPEQIRAAWSILETNLLNSLTLLAAQRPGSDSAALSNSVQRLQEAGGQIPSWPGMPTE